MQIAENRNTIANIHRIKWGKMKYQSMTPCLIRNLPTHSLTSHAMLHHDNRHMSFKRKEQGYKVRGKIKEQKRIKKINVYNETIKQLQHPKIMPSAFNSNSQAGLATQAYNAVKLGNREALQVVIKSNNVVSETSTGGYPIFNLLQERFEGGATLLHLAAHKGSLGTLSLLISEKVIAQLVEINNRIKNAKEQKAREAGGEKDGYEEDEENRAGYVNLLKEALNSYDDAGNTPIHMAALSGSVEVFKFLMDAGADATKIGFYGKSVFHYAAAKGHINLLKYMIFEALPYTLLAALDHNDNSAAMVAAASGYEDVGMYIDEKIHEVRTKLIGR